MTFLGGIDPEQVKPIHGVRALVRDGRELLAIVIGDSVNDSEAIRELIEVGVIGRTPVQLMQQARLDTDVHLAIMPCSYVSGLTARQIYGEPCREISPIWGRPQLCVVGDTLMLLEVAAIGDLEAAGLLDTAFHLPECDKEEEPIRGAN